MRTLSLLSVAVVFVGASANADQVQGEAICSSVMPSLLELTTAISGAMDKFTDMHKSLMDSETAKTFVEVEAKGQELKKAVEDYRKAFVLACYGS